MNKIILFIKNKTVFFIVLIALLFCIYFGYQLIKPIIDLNLENSNVDNNFDVINNYFE
jgi:nitrogen fixation/metabolism regulation signal transduction histidine kinase